MGDFIPNIQFIFIIIIAIIFALMIPKAIDTITNVTATNNMCNNIPMQITDKDKKVRANVEYVRCNNERIKKLESYNYKKFIAVIFISIATLAGAIYIYVPAEKHTSLLSIILGSLLCMVISLYQNWYQVSNNTKTIVMTLILGSLLCSYNYLYNEGFDSISWLNIGPLIHINR